MPSKHKKTSPATEKTNDSASSKTKGPAKDFSLPLDELSDITDEAIANTGAELKANKQTNAQ